MTRTPPAYRFGCARQHGGWLQTVKVDQHIEGGVSNPIELEALVDEERPEIGKIDDKKVRYAVPRAVSGALLRLCSKPS